MSVIVEPLYLFSLAATQTRYLAIRQAAVAENVANANTPGYKAVDVAPFSAVYDSAGLQMAVTHANDLSQNLFDLAAISSKETTPWEVTYSGNSVSLEQEMLKSDEINRDYSLNTQLTTIFNRMLATSVKGPP
ncbi:flagellar basal body rod protein FlgB [Methylovirgula sp. HY1]|uniref:flagellar basal body rod protein FlgB n=1 Tax=Methylovirgula sp. HY1 TaxID=2822761 RepID=UPI0021052331|nr:flagellar basal body rod protein FlgB [Methylovirgula sp. HY1]